MDSARQVILTGGPLDGDLRFIGDPSTYMLRFYTPQLPFPEKGYIQKRIHVYVKRIDDFTAGGPEHFDFDHTEVDPPDQGPYLVVKFTPSEEFDAPKRFGWVRFVLDCVLAAGIFVAIHLGVLVETNGRKHK